MSLFQLDPQSISARVKSSGMASRPLTLKASLVRGILGFTIVSVAGFSPWAIFDQWFPTMSEMDLYVACTVVFVALSGPLLHRLIIGPGSLSRFYKLFALAFAAYASVWVAFWIWLRGDTGVIAGLLAGAVAMGAIISWAFEAKRSLATVSAPLAALSAIGYFAGEWIHGKVEFDHRLAGMLLWGLCYGIGFGAGLGLAFYLCQVQARRALAADPGWGTT